jgi:hypothetical protein
MTIFIFQVVIRLGAGIYMIIMISPGYWGYDMCYCFIMCDQ